MANLLRTAIGAQSQHASEIVAMEEAFTRDLDLPEEAKATSRVTERTDSRSKLLLAAVLDVGSVSLPVRIRNISAGGALIEGRSLPQSGSGVRLRRGSQAIHAKVAWSIGDRVGLQFEVGFEISDWLPKGQRPHQDQTDRRVARARAGFDELTFEAKHELQTDEIDRRITEELLFVARTLDAIGNELASKPIIVSRHGVALQKLDESSQVLGHLARLLASDALEEGIAEIDMQALKRRLLRRSLQTSSGTTK